MSDETLPLDTLIERLTTDEQTSVATIKAMISRFVAERDWRQFHAPKNISMALAVEAAELMEHFQWLTVEASREVTADADKMTAIGEELADILCYGLALANELNIDVAAAMNDKMRKNIRKYPKDEYQGRYGKDDPGQVK
ncbi:nucleotide pyrophosphohydrolase [Blastopirellula marina]|uniref:NTP pyrophosphohydrolase n=1 Tax=Blastopirellula marina TaxID=124 RepID=A0A2S8GII4_9BACT|nr:nucleotide pyrophosphohydrolase [Blastopirellula marina]PQO44141.1 NTP pyrophosphohydrolase [Blastopirellula marina]